MEELDVTLQEENVQDQDNSVEEVPNAQDEKSIAERIKEVSDSKKASDTPTKEEKTPDYQPNYTYSAYDKEYQMPEWSKALIKDKATEDQFRILYCKAEALDDFKAKHEDLKTRYETDSAKMKDVLSRLDEAQFYLDNKDYGAFFERINVPVEDVVNFVKELIKYHDLPPDQRSIYDRSRNSLRTAYQHQNTLVSLQEQNAQLMRNQHEFEYQKALSLPEVEKFRKVFDERLGEGAFRKHADSFGEAHYLRSGKSSNISPLEAIQGVMSQYKGLFEAQPVEPTVDSGAKEPQRKSGGVIPNVGRGKGLSPTKKVFSSLEDLRKHAKTMAQEQAMEA